MWIKAPVLPLNQSGATCLNFLWKDDNIPLYLMDNHRAAWWCWMRHVQPEDQYNFIHIDAHWDLGALPDQDFERLKAQLQDLARNDLSFYEQFQSIDGSPLIRWDNYIEPFLRTYQKWETSIFHAHQVGWQNQKLPERAKHVDLPQSFFDQLKGDWSDEDEPITNQIINVDIDYAFVELRGEIRRFVDDSFLIALFRDIREQLDAEHVKVITVALSPEFCGGWSEAVAAWLAAADGLGVASPIALDGKKEIQIVL